ncbi:hypothetical protein EVJ58_g7947 [Rhodofomes roseus]|uniref:Uncharacterized protein n=1 Tax=Rhodofomes roseus TaxID=34475 RepID=A0A4Y9Y1H0_9APHY|nr:hypothetical protein EVJ58_g7947 [Rhodofomes roseus]
MLKHSAREESDGLLNSSRSSFELLDTEYKGSPKVAGAYKSSSRFARPLWQYALATLLLVALTDLAFLAYIARIFATEYFDAADLPLANPYIGLKELYDLGRVEPDRIEPLLNRPRVATQVFRDEPDRAGSRGKHEVWNTVMGTLSPYDRHLLIDDTTRTIAQFRAMDFGMEECSLVLRLPGPSDHVEGKDQPALSSTALQLQICPLDIPRFLDSQRSPGMRARGALRRPPWPSRRRSARSSRCSRASRARGGPTTRSRSAVRREARRSAWWMYGRATTRPGTI